MKAKIMTVKQCENYIENEASSEEITDIKKKLLRLAKAGKPMPLETSSDQPERIIAVALRLFTTK